MTSGERRERILRAAAKRFAEFGFAATTVRQIADDVQILSGSLYHHFATKEEMLDEIVRDGVRQRREAALRIAALPVDAEVRLVTLLADELRALTEDFEVHTIVFHERKFFRRNPDLHYLTRMRKEAYEAWSHIIRDGIGDGLFREDTDVYLTISTVTRILTSGADWFRHEDASPIDAMAEYSLEQLTAFYTGFVLGAIRAPAHAAAPIPQPLAEF